MSERSERIIRLSAFVPHDVPERSEGPSRVHYSPRRPLSGSIDAARRAGMKHATNATIPIAASRVMGLPPDRQRAGGLPPARRAERREGGAETDEGTLHWCLQYT